MDGGDRELVWLHGELKTPPLSLAARRWAGLLLRLVQRGQIPTMPHSRPMPAIGLRCHELRVNDAMQRVTWRIVYRIDVDAIVIADVFCKKVQKTPKDVIEACKRRLRLYDTASR